MQIASELQKALNTNDVAVVIEAKHFCVHSRGIKDTVSTTTTADYSGKFNDNETRKEFLHHINNDLLK